MSNKISIAIDAMGGDNSPDKTIEGVKYSVKNKIKDDSYLIYLVKNMISIDV